MQNKEIKVAFLLGKSVVKECPLIKNGGHFQLKTAHDPFQKLDVPEPAPK